MSIVRAHVADFERFVRQRERPRRDGEGFLIAALMIGINNDRDQSARLQQFDRRLKCEESRLFARDAAFILAGKPAQIEHDCSKFSARFGRQKTSHVFMAVENQRALFQHSRFAQSRFCRCDRGGLKIKRKDASGRTHALREQQRVVPIPRRCVDDPCARRHTITNQFARPFDGSREGSVHGF